MLGDGCDISPSVQTSAAPSMAIAKMTKELPDTSVASPLSSLERIDMAAVWVQAIWMASAASISSLGAAAVIIARAAFMAVWEIVPKGDRGLSGILCVRP